MNCSGIIRRTDELGRVVIPVEIRRVLNIKEGENLEFLIIDNKIELKKKSIVDGNVGFFKDLSNKLGEVIEGDFFITDRQKVFVSNNNEIIDKKLDNKFINLLSSHEETEFINSDLSFDNIIIKNTFYIYPYYVESDIAGFLVLYNIKNINKYSKLIKFLISYIHDKLSL